MAVTVNPLTHTEGEYGEKRYLGKSRVTALPAETSDLDGRMDHALLGAVQGLEGDQ